MLHEIDLSRADLNLLVLFEVVLDERHVGRSAQRLHLSPSAVSHGLGRLRRLLNDPLFLRTPKGVEPTARAKELADPIADVLARARRVISTAAPFDPATSGRRLAIGAPDAIAAAFLPALLADMRENAPHIGLRVRHVHPETVVAELDARRIDLAVAPIEEVPARFVTRALYLEEFVIASRAGHPFAEEPTLDRYCEMQHLVVSISEDTQPYVDRMLAKHGRSRRVALRVPNFMLALALLAETDLLAAAPPQLLALHADRFGVIGTKPPLALGPFQICALAPRVALMDAGLAWLFDRVSRATETATARVPHQMMTSDRSPI